MKKIYFSPIFSSETVNFFLPVALLLARTLRPFADAIRSRKPCLFFLFLFEGWNVLFVILIFIGSANLKLFFIPARVLRFFADIFFVEKGWMHIWCVGLTFKKFSPQKSFYTFANESVFWWLMTLEEVNSILTAWH